MPRISTFYGIVIAMYFDDHPPPHFHARYGEYEAQVSIASGEVLQGTLPRRALGLVQEWVELHRAELESDWELGAAGYDCPSAMTPPYEIRHVDHLGGFRLRLTFADGVVTEIDLAGKLAGPVGPVFEPLRDPVFFAQVRVDRELGTIVWPNGADLAPDALHEAAVTVR